MKRYSVTIRVIYTLDAEDREAAEDAASETFSRFADLTMDRMLTDDAPGIVEVDSDFTSEVEPS